MTLDTYKIFRSLSLSLSQLLNHVVFCTFFIYRGHLNNSNTGTLVWNIPNTVAALNRWWFYLDWEQCVQTYIGEIVNLEASSVVIHEILYTSMLIE